MNKTIKNSNSLAMLIIGTLFLIYIWVIFKYTASMPVMDDYDVILRFLTIYDSLSWQKKIEYIFGQFGEHRLIFTRIVELIFYKLFGEVNFLYLTLFGNLGWFFTILLLWKYVKKYHILNILYFIPIILLLLSFAHSALTTWAMTSIQQYWQLFFSILSIYYITEKKLFKSIIMMILAITAGGGGIVLIPILLLYTFVKKEWKQLVIILSISIIILYIYFILLDYQQPHHRAGALEIITNTPNVLLSYILIFLANFSKVAIIAKTIAIIFIFLSFLKIRYWFKNSPFILFSIVFIIVTATAAGLSRAGAGEWQAFSSRYAIYSLLFVSLVYIGYMQRYKNSKKIFIVAILFSSIIYLFNFISGINDLQDRKFYAEHSLMYPSPGHAEGILKRAYRKKIFTMWNKNILPSNLIDIPLLNGNIDINLDIAGKIDVCCNKINRKNNLDIIAKDKGIYIQGTIADTVNQKNLCGVIVIIDNYKKIHYLEINNNEKYRYSKLDTTIDTSYLQEGNHTLEIRAINSNCNGYYKVLKTNIHILPLSNIDKLPKGKENFDINIEQNNIKNGKLNIKGWYVVKGIDSSKISVIIDINSTKYLANSSISRPDVAKVYKNQKYFRSGFDFNLPIKNLHKGKNEITIYLLKDNNIIYKMKEKLSCQI